MDINSKIVLITGAAMRVGRVIALTLAEKGAHIAFTYLSDEEPWRETLAEIEAEGVKGLALQLDVRRVEQPKACVETVIEQFGRLDILVNNASVWLKSPFLEIDYEAWNAALARCSISVVLPRRVLATKNLLRATADGGRWTGTVRP